MQNGAKIPENDVKMEPKSVQNRPKWEPKVMQESDRNFRRKKIGKIGPKSGPEAPTRPRGFGKGTSPGGPGPYAGPAREVKLDSRSKKHDK